MSEEIKNTDQQPTNSTPEDKGDQGGEKMFTQEEVNRIVAERLARERTKGQPTEQEQRETDLTQREQLADGREWLAKSGYPVELAAIVGAKPLPEFKDCVMHTIVPVFERWKSESTDTAPQKQPPTDSLLRRAFGLK